jgi:hypothetical protein
MDDDTSDYHIDELLSFSMVNNQTKAHNMLLIMLNPHFKNVKSYKIMWQFFFHPYCCKLWHKDFISTFIASLPPLEP